MAVTADWIGNADVQAYQGKINWLTGTIKCALLSAVPNPTTAVHWSDVSANEVTGTGYTAGGATVTSPTLTYTAANSWATAWAASTAYAAGAVVRPATGNGYLYQCVTAGSSGATAPTWPTVVGQDVTDGTVTWVCAGTGIVQFSSAAVSWANATISAVAAVFYDATSGVATTEPLIGVQNFGGTVSSTNGTYQLSPDSLGWLVTFPS